MAVRIPLPVELALSCGACVVVRSDRRTHHGGRHVGTWRD